jgi:hypothetical protein
MGVKVIRRSGCGCTWERRPRVGDVIVVQCIKHAASGLTPLARKATKTADALVARLRKAGKVPPRRGHAGQSSNNEGEAS